MRHWVTDAHPGKSPGDIPLAMHLRDVDCDTCIVWILKHSGMMNVVWENGSWAWTSSLAAKKTDAVAAEPKKRATREYVRKLFGTMLALVEGLADRVSRAEDETLDHEKRIVALESWALSAGTARGRRAHGGGWGPDFPLSGSVRSETAVPTPVEGCAGKTSQGGSQRPDGAAPGGPVSPRCPGWPHLG